MMALMMLSCSGLVLPTWHAGGAPGGPDTQVSRASKTWHVGADTNYTTIQSAIKVASDGDTILIDAGHYSETLNIDKSLTLKGSGKYVTLLTAPTIPDSDYSRLATITEEDCTIEDMFFDNSKSVQISCAVELSSGGTHISDCIFSGFSQAIVIDFSARDCLFENNSFENGEVAITSHDRISDSKIIYNVFKTTRGISLGNFNDGEISHNKFSEGTDGITMNGDDTVIADNRIDCSRVGLQMGDCSGFEVRSNEFIDCGILVGGYYPESLLYNTISDDNTVNGQDIKVLRDTKGMKISQEYGQLIMVNCSDITVEGMDIDKCSAGVIIGLCDNVTVKDNSFTDLETGLDICLSTNISISANEFYGVETAIQSMMGMETSVVGNDLHDLDLGMVSYFDEDTHLENNTFEMMGYGIFAIQSNGFLMKGNQFLDVGGASFFDNGDNITFQDNIVKFAVEDTEANFGFYFFGAMNINLINNELTTLANGIYLSSCSQVTLISNRLTGGGLEFGFSEGGDSQILYSYDLQNNSINGRPILVIRDVPDPVIPDSFGMLFAVNCTPLRITHRTLDETTPYMFFENCNDLSITECNLTLCEINIYDSIFLEISNNLLEFANLKVVGGLDVKLAQNRFVSTLCELSTSGLMDINNNTIGSNSGLNIYDSDGLRLDGNVLDGTETAAGGAKADESHKCQISIMGSSNVVILNTHGRNGSYRISIANSRDVSFYKNMLKQQIFSELELVGIMSLSMEDNEIHQVDCSIREDINALISKNTFTNCRFFLSHCTTIIVINNTFWDSDLISAEYCGFMRIESNIINRTENGVKTFDCHEVIIKDNAISNSEADGIECYSIQQFVIENNFCSKSPGSGLLVKDSYFGVISNCTFQTNSKNGMDLQACNFLSVVGGSCRYNGYSGIDLVNCENFTINQTTMSHNNYGLKISYSKNAGVTGNVLEANLQYAIYVVKGSNITIENNTCTGSQDGIRVVKSDHITLTGNTCGTNQNGIYVKDSDHIGISGNDCRSNRDKGIYVSSDSEDTTLDGNRGDVTDDADEFSTLQVIVIVSICVIVSLILAGAVFLFILQRRRKQEKEVAREKERGKREQAPKEGVGGGKKKEPNKIKKGKK